MQVGMFGVGFCGGKWLKIGAGREKKVKKTFLKCFKKLGIKQSKKCKKIIKM